MPALTIFSSVFCNKERIVEQLLKTVEFRHITDDQVVRQAADLSGMDEKSLRGAFGAKTSVFNKFTHEKERSTAWLRLAVAEMIAQGNLLVDGFSSMLVPAHHQPCPEGLPHRRYEDPDPNRPGERRPGGKRGQRPDPQGGRSAGRLDPRPV